MRLGRWAVLGVVCAAYRGGTLAYHEFAVGVAVRKGARLGVTLPWIWVDSEASLQGGRAWWAIPKRLAVFSDMATGTQISADAGEIATLAATPRGPRAPRVALKGDVVQGHDGRAIVAPASAGGRPRLCRVRLHSSLPVLAGLVPLFGLRLEDLRLDIGAASPETPVQAPFDR